MCATTTLSSVIPCRISSGRASCGRVGGSLANLVTMTVFINDPRHGDAFVKIRSTMFEAGRYPASALITVSHFARPGIVLEIQGVAVL